MEHPSKGVSMEELKPKCVICKKKHNPKSKNGNYGWHINNEGNVEKCAFQILPMQIISKSMRAKE